MARFHRALALPLALALLASCAQVVRTPLSDAHRQAITSTKTVGNLSQQEIGTSIENSQAGVAIGGLLGAIVDTVVDNSRANKAESGAAPLRDLLVGYDPRAGLETTLAAELKKIAPFQGTQLELKAEPRLDKVTLSAMVDAAGTDALLIVDFDYRLSPNANFINVTAVATILPTKAAASPVLQSLASTPSSDQGLPSPLIYRGIFMSSFTAPAEGAGVSRWIEDKGSAARVAIEGGIAEVIRMLVWDLEQAGPKGTYYGVDGATATVLKQFGLRQWYLLDTRDGRTWFRAQTGELASTGDSYPGLTVTPVAATPAAPRPDAVPPTVDARGALTFEFANEGYMRQGGAIDTVKYSEVPGDVSLRGYSLADGVLTMKGQIGLGLGSTYAGLGPRFQLNPDGKPMDANKIDSVTLRVASTTRVLRIRLVGADQETKDNGCYPTYFLEVDEQMKEYTVPISRFAPENYCATRGRSLAQTVPQLTAIEVVGTRVTELPLTISVGPTTLNP